MSLDPRKLDWPVPHDTPGTSPGADKEVLVVSEDIGVMLAELGSMQRDAFIDLLARCWSVTPSPRLSLQFVWRLLSALEASEQGAFVERCLHDRERFGHAFALMGHSQWIGGWLARGAWRRFLAYDALELSRPLDAQVLFADIHARIGSETDADMVMKHLRRWHADWTTVIAHHDLNLHWQLETVTQELSLMADCSMEAALASAQRMVLPRHGQPRDDSGHPITLGVIAFGKLGGCELNYSSDIDVMFILSGEGKTDGEMARVTASIFSTKVAQMAMRLLTHKTEYGSLYRVDTRLRPDGGQGPLVRTLEGTLKYYATSGSTFERQALLKIRPCAGDLELGRALVEGVQGFIHRRFLTVKAINEIKELKRQIEHHTELRDETYLNVKTGFGGIRDIEFVVQFLQLLHGGRHPEIRCRGTLESLQALAQVGCLRSDEAARLGEGYRLLRRIEHGLQLEAGLQTHRLPTDSGELELLARRLGYSDHDDTSAARQLYRDLKATTLKVRGLMLRLFTDLFPAQATSYEEAELVLNPAMPAERAAQILARYGLFDPERSLQLIAQMGSEASRFRHYESRARTYLASMMPSFLDFVGKSPDPDATLANFERLAASFGAKGVFYELIAQKPRALELFGTLCASSRGMVESFESFPGIVDGFLDAIQTGGGVDADQASIAQSLSGRLRRVAPVETDAGSDLGRIKAQKTLELVSRYLMGELAIERFTESLTQLADTLVTATVQACLLRATSSPDRPLSPDAASRLVVLALGTWGGSAMTVASDLDIVFVYDAPESATIDRAGFEAVAHEIRGTLSAQPSLYEVDLRLRPMGGAGAVALSSEGFERYLHHDAAFWERLALTRARIVYGAHTETGRRIGERLMHFVYERELPQDLANAVREMRGRLEDQAGSGDLKRGRGGLTDIEFTVQYLQLMFGGGDHAVRSANFLGALHALETTGRVRPEDAQALREGAGFLRRSITALQLASGMNHADVPGSERERGILARRLGMTPQAYAERLQAVLQMNRALFERLVAPTRKAP